MKTLLNFSVSTVLVLFAFVTKAIEKNEFGVYKTKEDYLTKNLSVVNKMQESENFNVGELIFKDKENKEHKINCLREKYWGFRYLDGNDYIKLDGFYAKVVILGNINLLISPKAEFYKDENEKYTFSCINERKVNFYFTKDLNNMSSAPFEKLIADEKTIVKEYRSDRDNYGDFINKQIKYLKKYNEKIPKQKKEIKKRNKK